MRAVPVHIFATDINDGSMPTPERVIVVQKQREPDKPTPMFKLFIIRIVVIIIKK